MRLLVAKQHFSPHHSIKTKQHIKQVASNCTTQIYLIYMVKSEE